MNSKVVSLSFLGCSAIALWLFRALAETGWAAFRIPVPQSWILSPADIIGIVVGILTFILLILNATAKQFTGEVIGELEKVTWPNRKETVISTGVVSVLVGICAILLFGFDFFWGTLVNLFYQ